MGPAVVGITGTLVGVLIGAAAQHMQAFRNRKWLQEDALSNTKRGVYAEYLRAISASYAQAMSGQRSRWRTLTSMPLLPRSKSFPEGTFQDPLEIL